MRPEASRSHSNNHLHYFCALLSLDVVLLSLVVPLVAVELSLLLAVDVVALLLPVC